jgi:F-type H+-transporting ATPase subunit b
LATSEFVRSGSGTRLRACAPVIAVMAVSLPAQASGDSLQLVPDFFFTSPILLLAFILLIYPLNALIFKPILKVMDQRDDQIAGARRRADQIETQADEALKRYEDSVSAAREEVTGERRTSTEAARVELMATTRAAKDEAVREIDNARAELEASLTEARSTIRASADALATLAAERILGRSLSS